jgi:hypothetical protein
MSAYGKVISGGAKMSKGLTKGINDKLSGHAAEADRRAVVAGAVRKAFTQNPLSDNHTQNVNGGKFTTPKLPKSI